MGSNKWQSSEVWPPNNTEMTPFYLSSNGNANTLNGDGKLTSLKRKVDNSITVWLEPVGDKSKLRNLRGITFKNN